MKDLQFESSVLYGKDGSVLGKIIFQHASLSTEEGQPSNQDSQSTTDVDSLDLPQVEKVGFHGKPLSVKPELIGREYIRSFAGSEFS